MSFKGMFVSARETRQFSAGDVIFAAGDSSSEMYGVISGAVELRDGDTPVLQVGPEGTFGEMGLIDSAPRSLSAVATEETEVAIIDERTFLFLVQETPMFALNVMRSLAARIREIDASR